MHPFKHTIYSALVVLLSFTACKKEDVTPETPTAAKAVLSIQFDNIAGDRNLQLNTGSYTNAAGESFNISLLQYFISNIKVTNSSGREFTVPADSSYFLVSEANAASQFVKVKVPEGDYQILSFVLGVDSLRSTMDISRRTGVLDPSGGMGDGMYWGWNSGYIFFKMEGESAAAPAKTSAAAVPLPPGEVAVMTISSQLVSVSTNSASPDAFSVPADFKRQENKTQ